MYGSPVQPRSLPIGFGRKLGYGQPVPRIRRPLLALIILVALLAIGYLITAIR